MKVLRQNFLLRSLIGEGLPCIGIKCCENSVTTWVAKSFRWQNPGSLRWLMKRAFTTRKSVGNYTSIVGILETQSQRLCGACIAPAITPSKWFPEKECRSAFRADRSRCGRRQLPRPDRRRQHLRRRRVSSVIRKISRIRDCPARRVPTPASVPKRRVGRNKRHWHGMLFASFFGFFILGVCRG